MSISLGTLKTIIRDLLGTSSDDPAYSSTILDPQVQDAYDSLLSQILRANPDYLTKTVTLEADSATSHNYTFSAQDTPVTDFAGWLEVRWTDEDGALLRECRYDELRNAGTDYFTITGPDDTPVLRTSKDSEAGTDLYFKYRYWPAEFEDDNSVPSAIPARFHMVVALECLFTAYGAGGEQRLPRELYQRWQDRRGDLLAHVGRRGVQNSRTRLDPTMDPI